MASEQSENIKVKMIPFVSKKGILIARSLYCTVPYCSKKNRQMEHLVHENFIGPHRDNKWHKFSLQKFIMQFNKCTPENVLLKMFYRREATTFALKLIQLSICTGSPISHRTGLKRNNSANTLDTLALKKHKTEF